MVTRRSLRAVPPDVRPVRGVVVCLADERRKRRPWHPTTGGGAA